MKYVAGVDVGSTQTKAVIVDENRNIVGRALLDMETSMVTVAEDAFRAALDNAGAAESDVVWVAGTGYGRYKITFGKEQITEISCHARGAVTLFPLTRTVIDIGGQDTKAIRVGPDGKVEDFTMNDKCAAGTGRFLGAASYALEMPLSELGPLALKSTNPVAKGILPEDVLMGVHQAITSRCVSLARRVGIEPEVTFTGGVSRNQAMVKLLEAQLGMPINVSQDAHFCGALGAALFSHDRMFGEGAKAAPAMAEEA
ncbi:MAG: 2-hydroxyglutaryl-CoA dehydratase [Rhodocyclaceae bacterium]|nr:2-hydroxyglutaryl-CoA dehydratase [Rhodocyclaceae bacterium]